MVVYNNMDLGKFVSVIIEIERHSNQKWEYDREGDMLYLDRVLPYPYFYPYAYGFFPNTLGNDGDELDILYITETPVVNYNTIRVKLGGYIVGGLVMEDEKGMDEKIFVVPENEINSYLSMDHDERNEKFEDIVWFFSQYKSKDNGKRWSKVHRVIDAFEATQIYESSVEKWKINCKPPPSCII
jgi:inorganic pyrophosphatase